jgi:acetyl esterase
VTYAFDPELAPFVPRLAPLDYSDPVAARAILREVMSRQPPYEATSPIDIADRTIPGPAGAPEVPVRIYRPAGRPGPFPALVFPHWGAFITGDLDTPHVASSRIADLVGAVVVSPDYRLAPEHPFPAGLDDCYAALEWTHANAAELDVDPEKVGVGGLSAGGGLAVGMALMARDRQGPPVRYLYLLFPQLDDRLDTVSAREFVDTPMLDRACLELSWKFYLGGGDASPYAAPARAEDLAGLPPTFVGACEYDPLRDEALHFANRLVEAGVKTEVAHYLGTFHGCIGLSQAAIARRMAAEKVDALRRGLNGAVMPAVPPGT